MQRRRNECEQKSSTEGCGIPGAWTKKGSVMRLSKNPILKKYESKGNGIRVEVYIWRAYWRRREKEEKIRWNKNEYKEDQLYDKYNEMKIKDKRRVEESSKYRRKK